MTNSDGVEIYKDEKLLHLYGGRVSELESELLGFALSNIEINENNRKIEDVLRDKIHILKAINLHLEDKYRDNTVAKEWIAVNKFIIRGLGEDILFQTNKL
jgi:hypothetical protein